MRRSILTWFFGSMAAVAVLFPQTADAQTAFGAIEGIVSDESGAVLPGVSVQVTSPALIEGARDTVTNESGSYRFLRLPVGQYTLRFTLTGFTAVQRQGVIINSGFTATINIPMKVGTIEETMTVVGESPVVDVRGTTTQTVLTADVIAVLPSSRNVFDMTKFVIGMSDEHA